MKRRLVFRRFPFNILTIPLLVNIFDHSDLAHEFKAEVCDTEGNISRGDIVIFSLMTPFLPIVADEIRRLHELGAYVIVGGPHIDDENYELLLEMGATAVCSGPAETTLIPIVSACLNHQIQLTPFWNNKYLTAELFSKHLPICTQLPTLPPLELMRGCGYSCTYCATSRQKRILRDWFNIIEYLSYLHDKKAQRINFIVPSALEFKIGKMDVTDSLVLLFETCRAKNMKMIEYGIFPSEIRPESVQIHLLSILKKYVCNKNITLGLQSGSPSRLEKINRRGNIELVKNALDKIIASGMGVNLDLIIGFPGEDLPEMKESLDTAVAMMKNGLVKIQVHRFFPLGRSADQWLMPSEITSEKEIVLDMLEKKGLIKGGWRLNDQQWRHYFIWLKKFHPRWLRKYV